MSALVNAFWILATCFLLAMLAVVLIIGAACLEKAQAESCAETACVIWFCLQVPYGL